jgi:hypothetical protein
MLRPSVPKPSEDLAVLSKLQLQTNDIPMTAR